MITMISDWLKSSLQGLIGGLLGTALYRLLLYFIGCHPVISIVAPFVALAVILVLGYFALKLFFKYASYTTIYNYVSFFGGMSMGSLIGWVIWGIKKFCNIQ